MSGRVFFEHVIRDNLDAGRPNQVSLIFDRRLIHGRRRSTPGPLRTETTINNTRDFTIGKRLTNLPALREIGFAANRRLLGVQRLSHNPIRAAEPFTTAHEPIITDDTGTTPPGSGWATGAPTL